MKPMPLLIDIVSSFVKLVRGIEPKWDKAYLRFRCEESWSEVKATYVHGTEVLFVGAIEHGDVFGHIDGKGRELLASMGETQGVFLLRVNSPSPSLQYKIKYEYVDMDRWKISKMDGGTGIPEGIED
jgi:hypothetical protein